MAKEYVASEAFSRVSDLVKFVNSKLPNRVDDVVSITNYPNTYSLPLVLIYRTEKEV